MKTATISAFKSIGATSVRSRFFYGVQLPLRVYLSVEINMDKRKEYKER